MLRVVVALLLAAAALAAVDLRSLVDVVYNTTSPLERFAPTYVFEVDGCRVLVYVADPTLEDSPLRTWMNDAVYFTYDPVYYLRIKEPRPLTSAEVERMLDALFQALGPSAEVGVGVCITYTWCSIDTHVVKDAAQAAREAHSATEVESAKAEAVSGVAYVPLCTAVRNEYLRLEARNATQLKEELHKAVGTDFYLGAADVREAVLKKCKASEWAMVQATLLYRVVWRHGDIIAYFVQDDFSIRLTVMTTNFSAAVEALEKAREAAGEAWSGVVVMLWHGPYFVPDGAKRTLREAALGAVRMFEEEYEETQEPRDEEKWARRAWGFVDVFFVGELGPVYVVFLYPRNATPDKATAERFVRRLVELSGYCKSPLVVEFWPEKGYELHETPFYETTQTPLWPYAAAVGAILAVAVGIVLTRRRKWPALFLLVGKVFSKDGKSPMWARKGRETS